MKGGCAPPRARALRLPRRQGQVLSVATPAPPPPAPNGLRPNNPASPQLLTASSDEDGDDDLSDNFIYTFCARFIKVSSQGAGGAGGLPCSCP